MSAGGDETLRAWVALGLAAWSATQPWLQLVTGLGGDALAVFAADDEELAAAGARRPVKEVLAAAWEESERALESARRLGLGIASFASDDYPPLLREIPDPPLVLYWRGRPPVQCGAAVAIVGSRRCSTYGLRVATSLAREVAAAGIVVVSGLARGIDAAAHRGAMTSGVTAAVLAGGLDRIYPAAHSSLAGSIADHGGWVLSEQPPGRAPVPRMFPYRNRIITGLARATVVVEAGERSGSLASARHALAQGRDLYAVPGPIDSPCSRGTNALAQEGSYLLTEAADLAATRELSNLARPQPRKPAPNVKDFASLSDAKARMLLAMLQRGGMDLDGLVEGTSLDGGRVLALLTALEMDGLVERGWAGTYSCSPLAAGLSLPGAAFGASRHP
ncbi:MAG TPA: DNA-processing protein DprA [Candidatus Limnocylindrales bacterium]|nr:DNA-processing protein DprA [Candidatus Limnocylindrales bacterium]